jgi:hypothetical protein
VRSGPEQARRQSVISDKIQQGARRPEGLAPQEHLNPEREVLAAAA